MKKIKQMWNNNRVLWVLVIIVLVCFCIITGVMVRYFFGVNTSSYGDRLDDIADLPYTSEDQEILINALKENEGVADATVKVKGKIIYIRILFNASVSLDSAKNIANSSIEKIDSKYQSHYDLQYTLVQEQTEEIAGYTIMGAKNINREQLIWNNNTVVPDKSE